MRRITPKSIHLWCLLVYFHVSWGSLIRMDAKDLDIDFHRDNTGVYFDPVDFMEYNKVDHSLDESGLALLVNKIHSRFDHILVGFHVPPKYAPDGNFSNDLAPETVARHNLLLNESSYSSTFLKITLLLKLTSWENKEIINSRFEVGKKIVAGANRIFPGTVQSVLLDLTNQKSGLHEMYSQFYESFSKNGNEFKLGIQLDVKHCNGTSWFEKLFGNRASIPDNVYFSEYFDENIKGDSVAATVDIFKNHFYYCRKLVKGTSQTIETGFTTGWPDTNAEGRGVFSEYIGFWRTMNDWAGEANVSVFIYQAYDTPFATKPIMKTNGWWKLVPNSSYTSISQLLFEEKLSLVHPKQVNVTWIRKSSDFNRDFVGVHFNPFDLRLNAESTGEPILFPLIQQISTKFTKIFISTTNKEELQEAGYWNQDVNRAILSVPKHVVKWNLNRKQQTHNPLKLTMTFDNSNAKEVVDLSLEANAIFPMTVSQLIYSPSVLEEESLLDDFVHMVEILNASVSSDLGLSVALEECVNGVMLEKKMDQLYDFISHFSMKVIYVSATFSQTYSKLNLARGLPLFTVTLEKCQARVAAYFACQKRGVRVAFIASYSIPGKENRDGLLQFVQFWEQIHDWAVETKTIVILSLAFDPPKAGAYGWWRQGNTGKFEDKKEAAFRHATEKDNDDKNEKSWITFAIVTSVALLLIFLGVAVPTFLYLRKIRKLKYLTEDEIHQFFNGGKSNNYLGSNDGIIGPYQRIVELPKKTFTIDDSSPLGSGAFGKVCLGRVMKDEEMTVAVKMTNRPGPASGLRALLFEIKILSFLGKHPNVVELIGAYTAELRKGKAYVFLELCELGSLQGYLRKCKRPAVRMDSIEGDKVVYSQSEIEDPGTELDQVLISGMSRWASEIANGMEFIASKHIVHLDIATRNILLTAEKRAKITDFGLSRRMYNYHSYMKKEQEPLPWRSMAPESLRKMQFTEKSDVWAYGVLLWEMYSLGDEPYPGLAWDVNFPYKLENGLRMSEPKYCRNGMYAEMLRCWTTDPERRPTFSDLAHNMAKKANCVCVVGADPEEFIGEEAESYQEACVALSSTTSETVLGHQKRNSNNDTDSVKMNENTDASGKSETTQPILNHVCGREKWSNLWTWSSVSTIVLMLIIIVSILAFKNWEVQDNTNPGVNEILVDVRGQPESKEVDAVHNNTTLPISKVFDTDSSKATQQMSKVTGIRHAAECKEKDLGLKLLHAIDKNKEEAAKVLLPLVVKVNLESHSSERVLHKVLDFNDKKFSLILVKFLIEHGADLHATDEEGRTFLHKWVAEGANLTSSQFRGMASFLSERNALSLFNSRDVVFGRTPLMLVANLTEMDNATVTLLQSNGVDFTLLDKEGRSLLTYLVEGNKNRKLLAGLLDDGTIKFTRLVDAIDAMDLEASKVLILLGTDAHALNSMSKNLLHRAEASKDKAFAISRIKFMIENGANASATDEQGQTFLHKVVLENGSRMTSSQLHEMAEYLVAKNAANLFNVKENVHGRTPLMLAVKIVGTNNATATLLRTNGVDFTLLDKQGKSFVAYLADAKTQRNCEAIQATGKNESGVYSIFLAVKNEEPTFIHVYCDLVTDGGGWTVFQRRQPSTTKVDFERTWQEYADGFGILTESHWLGLDIISELTKGGDAELRIDLMDWDDKKRFAKYDHFQVDNETEKYKLHVSGYSGDAEDSLRFNNGMHFSTKDRDNDRYGESCAQRGRGAWWYHYCGLANLNGLYYENGRNVPLYTGVFWNNWHGVGYSMKRTEMKLRSKHFCKPTKG